MAFLGFVTGERVAVGDEGGIDFGPVVGIEVLPLRGQDLILHDAHVRLVTTVRPNKRTGLSRSTDPLRFVGAPAGCWQQPTPRQAGR